MSARVADLVRLEVSADPPPGQLVNLLPNPTGRLGGSGWEAAREADVVGAVNNMTPPTLQFTRGPSAADANFYSVMLPVTPGQWLGASWISHAISGGYTRARFLFYPTSTPQAPSALGPFTAYLSTNPSNRQAVAPMQVPANATAVRIQFFLYRNTSGAAPATGAFVRLRDVMVTQGANAAAVTIPPYSDAQFWTDVLPSCSEVDTDRLVLDVGELKAVFRDAALDPAVSNTLRAGRRMRLRAFNGTEWDDLFNGVIQRPRTAYDPRLQALDDPKAAIITVTAVDANQPLSNATRAFGTYDVAALPWVLESAGVPWSVNGSGNQVAAPALARQYQAPAETTVLEHLVRTRNGYYGLAGATFWVGAWVDRYGVLQVYDVNTIRELLRGLLRDQRFTSGTDEWEAFTNSTVDRVVGHATYGTALRATATAAGTTSWRTYELPVAAGIEYEFSYSIRLAVAGRRVLTYVRWRDAAGVIVSDETLTNTTGYGTSSYTGFFDRKAVAPAGAVTAQLGHVAYGLAAGEAVYSDRAQVYRYADAVITSADYLDTESGWDDENNFNSLTLDNVSGTGSGAVQATHGPYERASSVAAYGRKSATVRTAGWALGNTALPAYTGYLLDRNADPEQHVTEFIAPIRNQAEAVRHAFRDLYDRLSFVDPIPDYGHVVRVSHSIRPTRRGGTWSTTVHVGDLDRLIL